jgi:uncharacterized Ntn-hydrolase superfamily protein
LLAQGLAAPDACRELQAQATHLPYRQLTLIDAEGRTAFYSGAQALGINNAAVGKNIVSAGNLLGNGGVPAAIVTAFEASDPQAELGARVIAAMQAGLAAGGEAGPIKSAGLLVAGTQAWPLADLRVDWHEAPLTALADLWAVWAPQMHDYVTRALNPGTAPSYGVPGDEG